MTADVPKIRKPRTEGLVLWDLLLGSLAYNALLVANAKAATSRRTPK